MAVSRCVRNPHKFLKEWVLRSAGCGYIVIFVDNLQLLHVDDVPDLQNWVPRFERCQAARSNNWAPEFWPDGSVADDRRILATWIDFEAGETGRGASVLA